MKVLAIDPATYCGWALSHIHYGLWDLSIKRGESQGIKWILFENYLKDTIERHGVKVVAYERPGGRNFKGIESHSKLVGIIEKLCVELRIESIAFSATEIKKAATGKGNCDKQAMIDAAEHEFGYKGNDDNEADALWIHDLCLTKLKIS
jgi:Holliday junction resolvasome RuvABC endonuclease subunit